jgi:MFS family permease
MSGGSYHHSERPEAPSPPHPFFDGTRLGLEGTMLATLSIAIPASLHIALSTTLGYATRYAEGLPTEQKSFALFGFLFTALLAVVVCSMLMFFGGAITTMAYSAGLVALMLRWAGKRWGRERLASTVIGAAMGLLGGLLGSLLVFLLTDVRPSWTLYVTLFRWPAILTIDGIVLLWFSLNPLAQAVAGGQIGWRLGKQIEQLTLYWFW